MQYACTRCGAISDRRQCPRHRGQAARKAAGFTGQRGSTRQQRKRRMSILERDHHTCVYCGARADMEDHFIPVSRGGSEADSNMVASCTSCNLAKGDKLPSEFTPQRDRAAS